ncbi:protein lethal(3)malignant blood neoplasm 1 isoform X2 [Neocloeon triangulifer]|uniref:protein lethal(3)malignant blood neoplasm 1 isoform X2 n=1 Tax=Neocloeon triangulifer TaxID=2078957 RepID=UPI00286F2521|nr:protein lethal(3)malignant blood neoplasm 1 isoform X2 [Neocloeon triangulifer]
MPPVHAVLLVVLCWAVCSCRAQTSEEDLKRPYSFGFNIENMQHRQEMKDSRGIITGEYGFVTADGWYTTTYYATDEEGKFKILGRKRERVGPPVFPVQPVVTTPRPTTTTTTTPRPSTAKPRPGGIPGCASCIIPTTTLRPLSSPSGFKPSPVQGGFRPTAPYPPSGAPTSRPFSPTSPRPVVTIGSVSSTANSNSQNNNNNFNSNQFSTTTTFGLGGSAGGQGGAEPSGLSGGPNYRFNYTAGFHGHHETGLKDGSKSGGYFVNTRDGVSHRVTYEADARGFRPRISQVRLPAQDTPQVDTEKLAGLKGYEFVWFNRRR